MIYSYSYPRRFDWCNQLFWWHVLMQLDIRSLYLSLMHISSPKSVTIISLASQITLWFCFYCWAILDSLSTHLILNMHVNFPYVQTRQKVMEYIKLCPWNKFRGMHEYGSSPSSFSWIWKSASSVDDARIDFISDLKEWIMRNFTWFSIDYSLLRHC